MKDFPCLLEMSKSAIFCPGSSAILRTKERTFSVSILPQQWRVRSSSLPLHLLPSLNTIHYILYLHLIPMPGDRFFWLRDEEFGRQTLAGLNPCCIQLVTVNFLSFLFLLLHTKCLYQQKFGVM